TWKRIPSYELFVEGGKEGIQMAISLLPFLLGMIVAISVLRSSGAIDAAVDSLAPVLAYLGVPGEILPLAFIRPISGAASLGMTTELIANHGTDSFIGRLNYYMQVVIDTTLYILTVYYVLVMFYM